MAPKKKEKLIAEIERPPSLFNKTQWTYFLATLFLILTQTFFLTPMNLPALLGGLLQNGAEVFWNGQALIDSGIKFTHQYQVLPALYMLLGYLVLVAVLCLLKMQKYLKTILYLYLAYLSISLVIIIMLMTANMWNNAADSVMYVFDSVIVWVYTVVLAAVWYHLMDHELQCKRARGEKDVPTCFIFPNVNLGQDAWIPYFPEYLFLSFTTAAAWGPDDTLPLRRRAKLVMVAEVSLSLILICMVIARAVGFVS